MIQDTKTIESDWVLNLAQASMITAEQYEKARQEVGAKGTIKGVPVGGNFNEYTENVRKESQKLNLTFFESTSKYYAAKTLSDNAVLAHADCVRGGTGVSLTLQQENQASYTVLLRSKFPATSNLKGQLEEPVNVKNGVELSKKIQDIPDFKLIDRLPLTIFPEDLMKEITINISVAGSEGASITLPPIDRPRFVRIVNESPRDATNVEAECGPGYMLYGPGACLNSDPNMKIFGAKDYCRLPNVHGWQCVYTTAGNLGLAAATCQKVDRAPDC